MVLSKYLEERLALKHAGQKKCLVMTHVVCGYPSFEENWQELEVMQEFGVDLVELQFPFSEPSADGPLFVKANQRAIESGVHVDDCFEFMQRVSAHFKFKVIMMGYYNTVFKTGHQAFLQRLKAAGGHGFILPDLPIDEAAPLHAIAAELGLAPIILMTPTNSDARLQTLAKSAGGFVYAVARKGVTGSNTEMNQELVEFIRRCKKATGLPIAVGFGVSTAADIEFIGKHADIAVIGTAALTAWERGHAPELRAFFEQLTN